MLRIPCSWGRLLFCRDNSHRIESNGVFVRGTCNHEAGKKTPQKGKFEQINRMFEMGKKELIQKGRMQKARVHVGTNGATGRLVKCFVGAFNGTCVRPEPCDVVKVKVHPGYAGSIEELIHVLCVSNGSVFLKQIDGATGRFLLFHKPNNR